FFTVVPNVAGGVTPTGNVDVTISGGSETCTGTVAAGKCTLTLTNAGSNRTITATYSGDTNSNGSSDTESHSACGSTTVTSTADSGAGTLRQAILDACDASTITFDTAGVFSTPQTITLLSELSIGTNVTIDGPDLLSQQVTINGGNSTFRLFKIQSGKTATIRDLKLTGGNVSASNGGAIWNDHGTLTLINLDITGNNASGGGGVYSDATAGGSATLNIINSTIRTNTAATGAGVYNLANGGGSATLNLTNSTLSGNNATGGGGGLNTDATGAANVAITNCTITDNRADSDTNASGTGGGVFVAGDSSAILRNSIVDLNFVGGSGSVGDDIQNSLDNVNSTHNLVGVCTACGLTNGVNNNQLGVTSGSLNIGALALNGGTVPTHALLSGSVAIEAGNNAYVVAPPFLNVVPITDERGTGFPRIVDADLNATATVDIGAYEAFPPVPTVSSIVRANSNPTNAASVNFTVTFSQGVTGVDTSDFALTTTGVAGASVSLVTPVDSSHYTVTVNTGTGSGTIRLYVSDDDSIKDATNQPLGGTGVGNGNFTSGEVYTVDKTVPTVSSINRADSNPTNAASVHFTVTFSESVTGVDSGDFALTTAGVSGASITNVSGSGSSYTVTVNTGSGDGTIRLDVTDNDSITDAATNPLGGPGAGNGSFIAGQVYTIDKTAPTVSSITRADASPTNAASVHFTVTFSESVTGVDTSDFALTSTGVSGASITNVSGSAGTSTVTVNTGSNSGTIRLDLIDDDSIADAAGNPLGGPGAGNGNFTAGQVYTVDK